MGDIREHPAYLEVRAKIRNARAAQAVLRYFQEHPEAGDPPLFHHRVGIAKAVLAAAIAVPADASVDGHGIASTDREPHVDPADTSDPICIQNAEKST